VDWSNGSFSTSPELEDGVNIVGLRVVAEDDERTVDGRSFFAGTVVAQGHRIPNAVRIHLSPLFLDDGDAEFDDIASVVEAVLVDPSVLEKIQQPFENDVALLEPTQATVESAAAELVPIPDAISMALTLHTVQVAFDLTGKEGFESLLSGPGVLDIEQVDIALTVVFSTEEESISATVTDVEVSLLGFGITHEQLESLGSAVADALTDYAKDYVETSFEELTTEKVGPLLINFLQGFEIDTTVGEDPPLNLSFELESIAVAPHGLNLNLSASVTSPLGTGVPFGPQFGSLTTASAPVDPNFSSERVAFVIDDDAINQFLFAYWFGGSASAIRLTPEEMEAFDLSGLPAAFQPLQEVTIDLLLPPTLSARNLAADDYAFDVSIGDLLLSLSTTTGRQFAVSINARAGVSVEWTESGGLKPRIDARPKHMILSVGCYQSPPNFDPGSVASLLRLGIPPLLTQSAAGFSFEIPSIGLNKFTEIDSLATQALTFPNLKARIVGPDRHLLLLEGSPTLQEVSAVPSSGP
jgi:hypothetical protein